jgi:hypothetical protein
MHPLAQGLDRRHHHGEAGAGPDRIFLINPDGTGLTRLTRGGS